MSKQKMCTRCGTVSNGIHRGSVILTLIMLVPLTVIAIIYEIWRTACGRCKCPKCKAVSLIPADSPMAQTFAASPPLPPTANGGEPGNVLPFKGGQ